MFNAIISAIVGGVVAISGWFGLHYFEKPLSVGNASVTTINSTDRLTDSRAVINTNFDNLNTDKLSINTFIATTTHPNISSLPSLASVGTITTGTWSGTAIAVAKGGTGTTSPTATQVIIGNGASGFKVIGNGTSGQFLTSNGNAVDPSWQSASIDQTQNYNWTGQHSFNASTTLYATTTIAASSVTNKALVLNTVPYQFPSTQGASSTALLNNGSGVLLSYNPALLTKYKTGTITTSGSATITTTIGFTATAIQFFTVATVGTGGSSSVGSWVSPSTQNCAYGSYNANGGTWSANVSGTQAVCSQQGTNPSLSSGIVGNITSTSFDLVFTKGTNDVYINYIATGY